MVGDNDNGPVAQFRLDSPEGWHRLALPHGKTLPHRGANSSGGEHLPYKQGVGGSKPPSPTIEPAERNGPDGNPSGPSCFAGWLRRTAEKHQFLSSRLSTSIPQRIHKEIRLVHRRKCIIRRLFYCILWGIGDSVSATPSPAPVRAVSIPAVQLSKRERTRCPPVPGPRQSGCGCAPGVGFPSQETP